MKRQAHIGIVVLFSFIFLSLNKLSADDSAMKKYYGCYKVLKFKGFDSYKNFKAQTLKIYHEPFGPYQATDKTRLGGTQFLFCIHGGTMAFCQTLFSYDSAGYCSMLKKGGEYCLFAGEACDITPNDGITCGGHIENVEVISKNNRLQINGSRLFNYAFYSSEFRGGLEAVVEPMPLNADGFCAP